MQALSYFKASAALVAMLTVSTGAQAQNARPTLADSFPIGSGGGALCQAQSRSVDPAIVSMFDRAWTIVCRDAAGPVGQVFALRKDGSDPMARVAASRAASLSCGTAESVTLADVGTVQSSGCTQGDNALPYRVLRADSDRFTYVAQGLAGYSSALELALRTIVADRMIEGKVDIASLGSNDAAAFARAQAAALDPQTILGEGYRRNNAGNYAEAAEFFDSLQERLNENDSRKPLSMAERINRSHEYTINRALQLSNLSAFGQADALFAQAEALGSTDRIQVRLARNFEAVHKLNQRDYPGALAILDKGVVDLPGLVEAGEGAVALSPQLSASINSGLPAAGALGVRQSTTLTPEERAAIIDAQALQLRGTILRLTGNPAEAREMLQRGYADAIAIREGRVTSITRLRAQILAEIALTHEAQGDMGQAENLLRQALDLLSTSYPETVALNGARARMASFLARRDRREEALTLYRQIIASTAANRSALTGLANQIQPYFDLLVQEMASRPELASDMFLAAQTLIRPGAADTMEALALELSGGNGDASRLFRQSVSLSRDIERSRIELAQLNTLALTDGAAVPLVQAKQRDIEALSTQQAETLSSLAAYPQYRAVSKESLTLEDLRAVLKPGEAYLKLAQAGNGIYAIYVDGTGATGYRVPMTPAAMDSAVSGLRETISTYVNGVQATYPFDVALARTVYSDLFGPVDARLAQVSHLVFEPDGAMLKLPVNLLITQQAGVDTYLARLDTPGNDEFDFRGIAWLGRERSVSTAVSARAFRETRLAPASAASQQYIGFGQNSPATQIVRAATSTQSVTGVSGAECAWPTDQWSRPIPANELRQAAALVGGSSSDILTEAAFTDDAIKGRDNLNQYRILHFATHGLVTAPRVGCPARPALVTSFSGPQSDGLLQFAEIFDLRLDADLVILSACDTAGQASTEATRAAGVATGGGSALDGLVRAFIGAGSRSVIASHWPAPEDYDATQRLIGGMFKSTGTEDIGTRLVTAQRALMDDPATSHPFYWAGFAIVGDGARPLLTAR